MSGYSGTPLAKKLGIKAGFRVATLDAADGFAALLDPLPPEVTVVNHVDGISADVVIAFFTVRRMITEHWPAMTAAAGSLGTVWVAWPKKTSGVATDITEDVFRTELLPTGWVDVKVCAITEVWSGLKFVLRKELRPSLR